MMKRMVFVLLGVAMTFAGCQCGATGEAPATDSAAVAGSDSVPMVVPPAAAMTMLTPQPIAPDVAIPVPVPMSPKNQGLPLPVEPANNNLIEQQRREWTVRGADTGGGGAVPAATGATELLVDATATTVIDGYYVYGFDYVAGMTDRDEKAGFMPQTDFVVSTHAI